ncbi:hypothetical protein N4T42_02990 [Riemerella anatipestifer]|uniref:hypothetical protein n=1 Tax=Riemerella anatipestifer TaxID=34085 RepID=UPI001BDABD69|nr:hypothetical protein [Riemerella anatipestifer]MBT0550492.1 hypothetical protein [Riemerella anatipestifer]MCE3023397.1 hypothetical protein [Riemerella anatipestifer]MCU7559266.1 hypothetical protein [Riemerella anatipestifer]MDY3448438.1 hypothetical protein [Riemerella anatipestifer]QYR02399.1 hypothetical protein J6M00_09490 [Riemerella anatipestifer]
MSINRNVKGKNRIAVGENQIVTGENRNVIRENTTVKDKNKNMAGGNKKATIKRWEVEQIYDKNQYIYTSILKNKFYEKVFF